MDGLAVGGEGNIGIDSDSVSNVSICKELVKFLVEII
jgi:hypothetical protein